ncbi:hypothetical protein SDC9_125020 [bioreactor metagenome]|uniref:NAD-specific glutamate dehydrogenase n=1 Tax=bioreactor metagenome TaxID=1076179 RepID=A0A645CLT3_9ZZZZ
MQSDGRLDLLQLLRVLVRVDPLAQLLLTAGEVLLGELADRLHREGAGAEGRFAHRQVEDVAGRRTLPVLVEQLLQRLGDDEPGDHLGGVVRRGLLALPAGQPEDERAAGVHHRLGLAGDRIGRRDEVGLGDVMGALDRHHPRALLRIAVLRHLVQIVLGEEAGVGHLPLVDRAQLVDAEIDVRDETAVLALLLLAQQQVAQHLLEGLVAELHLTDVLDGLRQEQVGAQAVELQPLGAGGLVGVGVGGRRVVALVDQSEQHTERVVEVGAGAGVWGAELDQGQVAQPVQAVAGLVLRRADRQHAELGGGLGVQQEQDAVDEPQRLAGQRLGPVGRQRRQALRPAALHHVVGDQLHRQPDALAQVLADPDGVLDRVLEHPGPPDHTIGIGGQRVGAEAGQCLVDLPAALGVVAVGDGLQVDGQVAALGPAAAFGDDQPAPGHHQRELRPVLADEQVRQHS